MKFREESGELAQQSIFRRLIKEDGVRRDFRTLFDSLPDGPERRNVFVQTIIDRAIPRLGETMRLFSVETQRIVDDPLLNDEVFQAAVINSLFDFLDRNIDPEQFEVARRAAFVEQGGFTPLNEIISYGCDDGVAHIHLADARTLTLRPRAFITAIIDGLEKLAKVLIQPGFEGVKVVTATSFIVAEHSGLLERAGFIIDGPIDEKTRQQHFKTEARPVSASHMSREDFLRRYLK